MKCDPDFMPIKEFLFIIPGINDYKVERYVMGINNALSYGI